MQYNVLAPPDVCHDRTYRVNTRGDSLHDPLCAARAA